jgi:hypothetical protein
MRAPRLLSCKSPASTGCTVQVDGVIIFENDRGMLAGWDDHIRSTCEALDSIITVVTQSQVPTS